jgi:hypothetical protein
LQLVLQVDADDFLEACVRAKTERQRPAGVEVLRPAAHDALDERVGLAADELRRLIAGDLAQRFNFVADGGAHAGILRFLRFPTCSIQLRGANGKPTEARGEADQ